MDSKKFIIILTITLFNFIHPSIQDGGKSHGEVCSLRSQAANLFRENDSPEGCMSSKGLVCLNHKCVCADPSNVFEEPDTSSISSASPTKIFNSASSFLKNLMGKSTTTTPAPSVGGKCVGRAGSPCFTDTSTCVAHAICEGSPKLCKCQGIYSSNTQGKCSKSSTVVTQVIKKTIG